METREQTLKHLAEVVTYLQSCNPTEAYSGAQRWLSFMEAWIQPSSPIPAMSLLDAQGYTGLVEESGRIYGLCPHHLVPYHGNYQVTFQPDLYITGLSSISRVVDYFCRQALLQETLTQELGLFLYRQLQPQFLKIRISARHFCKEMQTINHSSGSENLITCWEKKQKS